MARVQLALRVPDLEASIAFYRSLFGIEPAKLRPGYANFAVTPPASKPPGATACRRSSGRCCGSTRRSVSSGLAASS